MKKNSNSQSNAKYCITCTQTFMKNRTNETTTPEEIRMELDWNGRRGL